MSDAGYRRELEEELERLVRELADVRVVKAQTRQRVEQLQLEQNQLKDQLGKKAAGDKELRSDLAQQLHTLHQVVRQKKQEHSKVKTEWERSQEQYNQLKQTVDLLQDGTTNTHNTSTCSDRFLNEDDEEEDEGEDQSGDLDAESNKPATSTQQQHQQQQQVAGEPSFMDNLAQEMADTSSRMADDSNNFWEESTLDGCDNGTVFSEHTSCTKDSIAIHRNRQIRAAANNAANSNHNANHNNNNSNTNGSDDHLSRFFSRHDGGQARPSTGSGGGGGLGSFFEKEEKRKTPKREEEKDLKSANE